MSGNVSDRKRLVTITAGNIAHKHIYLSGHRDFFLKEFYSTADCSSCSIG